jgi:UDP-N-acetylglucosamine:LPS N-acetylglucosamine transferase
MNALDYERSGACVVMEEDEITVNYFAETAELLSSDRHLLERMSSSAKSFGKPDAARKIALKLINLA